MNDVNWYGEVGLIKLNNVVIILVKPVNLDVLECIKHKMYLMVYSCHWGGIL